MKERKQYTKEFKEDACRIRTGAILQLLAAFRNTVMTILRRLNFPSEEGIEYFSEKRNHSIRFLHLGRIK